jgi:hypothetical protein
MEKRIALLIANQAYTLEIGVLAKPRRPRFVATFEELDAQS